MSAHDPLCPMNAQGYSVCKCEEYALVRADERAAVTWNQDTVITRRVAEEIAQAIDGYEVPAFEHMGPVGAAAWMRDQAAAIARRIGGAQ